MTLTCIYKYKSYEGKEAEELLYKQVSYYKGRKLTT